MTDNNGQTEQRYFFLKIFKYAFNGVGVTLSPLLSMSKYAVKGFVHSAVTAVTPILYIDSAIGNGLYQLKKKRKENHSHEEDKKRRGLIAFLNEKIEKNKLKKESEEAYTKLQDVETKLASVEAKVNEYEAQLGTTQKLFYEKGILQEDTSASLLKLKQLYEEGIITKEEYEAKKAELPEIPENNLFTEYNGNDEYNLPHPEPSKQRGIFGFFKAKKSIPTLSNSENSGEVVDESQTKNIRKKRRFFDWFRLKKEKELDSSNTVITSNDNVEYAPLEDIEVEKPNEKRSFFGLFKRKSKNNNQTMAADMLASGETWDASNDVAEGSFIPFDTGLDIPRKNIKHVKSAIDDAFTIAENTSETPEEKEAIENITADVVEVDEERLAKGIFSLIMKNVKRKEKNQQIIENESLLTKASNNYPFLRPVLYPLIGIEKVTSLFIDTSIYAALGVISSFSYVFFPLTFVFKKVGDIIYDIYNNSKRQKMLVQEAAALDAANYYNDSDTESEEEEKAVEESWWEKQYNNLYFVKRQKEADALARKTLLLSMQKEVRNELPVTYRYTLINEKGKKETNSFIAFSKMEVFSFFENDDCKVIKIETSKTIEMLYGVSSFSAKKFKNKDLIFWITQLSTYIKSGIPLTNAMRILSKQMAKDANKKRAFDAIIYQLTLGESFSTCLEKQGNVFPALLINMIKAAEATGELEATLDDMSIYYTEVEETRKQMVSAMTYPIVILIFALGVVGFILVYVIPQFADVYSDAGAKLNSFTLLILALSDFLSQYILMVIVGIIVFILAIVACYRKIKAFKSILQRISMKLPLFGNIIIYKEMSIFAKTFASLLKNNVFITESISILTNITNNEIYRDIMINTVNNIAKGDKISDSFKDHWAIPDIAYYMIVTGESTGELADMMDRVGQYYHASHKAIIGAMKSFIEPALIIFLAVVVGGIVMAVILPMFGLYDNVGMKLWMF